MGGETYSYNREWDYWWHPRCPHQPATSMPMCSRAWRRRIGLEHERRWAARGGQWRIRVGVGRGEADKVKRHFDACKMHQNDFVLNLFDSWRTIWFSQFINPIASSSASRLAQRVTSSKGQIESEWWSANNQTDQKQFNPIWFSKHS